MERLSASNTFFTKRVFPAIWLGFVGVFVVLGLFGGAAAKDPFFLVIPVVMLAFGFLMFKRMLWGLADVVDDGGTFLLVRRAGVEERIPFENVMNVSVSQYSNPRRITLRLRTPGKFGDEIAFIPERSGLFLNPFARDEIAERLIAKVDRTRHPDPHA